MRTLTLTLVLPMAVGCASNRRAQQPVPAPLLSALFDARPTLATLSPEFTVDAVPLGYPAGLIPTGSVRIVGGVAMPNEIIAVFADSTRRIAAVLEELFERVGYTRVAPSGSGFSAGPTVFCKGSQTVSAVPLTGLESALARVTYRQAGIGASCPGSPPRAAAQLSFLEVPQLTPPRGMAFSRTGGAVNSTNDVNSGGVLSGTALGPSAILAHYSAQLVAAGWTAAAPAIGDGVATQFFEARDGSGATWIGALTVAGSAATITMSLHMHLRGRP